MIFEWSTSCATGGIGAGPGAVGRTRESNRLSVSRVRQPLAWLGFRLARANVPSVPSLYNTFAAAIPPPCTSLYPPNMAAWDASINRQSVLSSDEEDRGMPRPVRN